MLLRIYGKIIISWEAQIEFLSLVPDHIPTPLLICELLTIVIHGVFSSRVKLQHLSQFYIADSVTSMLFPMSIHVILHKVLLILLMVIHPMLLPLIKNGFLKLILIKMIPLFDWLAQRPKCFSIFKKLCC